MPEKPLPNYEVVPLRSEEITVAVIQSRLRSVDPDRASEGNRANIEHMGALIRRAQVLGRKDLVVFHESPIGGFNLRWSKADFLKVAIDVPGPETELIGEFARRYQCYIEFGCYARLPDWPGHFINMGVIVGPGGDIVYRRWKTRNLSSFADLGTTIYDVLDEFVKRYGWDAVFPVARTDIGNIAIIPEIMEPEMARVFAMRGAEILIRYMTLGAGFWNTAPMGMLGGGLQTNRVDLQGMCIASGVYGLFVNHALSPDGDDQFDLGAGNSAIFDHNGVIIAEASSFAETVAAATIPLSLYRKRHSVPRFPKELYTHAYDDYQPRYPTNSYLESQPQSIKELSAHYKSIARW